MLLSSGSYLPKSLRSSNQWKKELSDDDREEFLNMMSAEKNFHMQRMDEIKSREQKRRIKKIKEEEIHQESLKRAHKEKMEQQYNESFLEIQRRQIERERAKQEYKEHLDSKKYKIIYSQKFRQNYEKNILKKKKENEEEILEDIKLKYKPIDFNDISKHTAMYESTKKIHEFELKKKFPHGISLANIQEATDRYIGGSNFKPNIDESKKFIIGRMSASKEYAKQVIKIHLPSVPMARSNPKLIKRRSFSMNMFNFQTKQILANVGNENMKQGNKNIDKNAKPFNYEEFVA